MVKDDEKKLMMLLVYRENSLKFISDDILKTACQIAEKILMPQKRLIHILNKWSECGFWEYGVSVESGWVTGLGLSKANEYFNEELERQGYNSEVK